MDDSTQRDIGALQARMRMQEKRMDTVEREIKLQLSEIYDTLKTLQTAWDSSRGSWYALRWVVGILITAWTAYETLRQTGVLR